MMEKIKSLKGKRILITSYGYEFFGGAELNAVELADQLVRFGMKPTFFSYSVGEPLKSYIEDRFLTSILTDQVDNLAESDQDEDMGTTQLNISDYDYIWIGGSTIPISILRQINTAITLPKFIFIHMSPLIGFPLDAPLFPELEDKIASRILSISEGTTNDAIYRILGVKGLPIEYWPNPTPMEYRQLKQRSGVLRRIAVISSSHPSDEIIEIKEMIESHGIAIDYIGKFNDNVKIVDANFYDQYDLIIGIGKNAKYSLTSGVPIYIYGRFGGPGYLNSENESSALAVNFSGRGSGKKTAQEITEEIISGYSNALQFHNDNRDDFIQMFSLDVIATKLFCDLENEKPKKVKFSEEYINWLISAQVLILQRLKGAAWLRKANVELEVLKPSLVEIKNKVHLQTKEIKDLRNDIRNIYTSRSWRLTKPIRLVGSFLRKVKNRSSR